MTSAQLQLNSELFSALQVISEDEDLMRKAVKALKRIVKNKRKRCGCKVRRPMEIKLMPQAIKTKNIGRQLTIFVS